MYERLEGERVFKSAGSTMQAGIECPKGGYHSFPFTVASSIFRIFDFFATAYAGDANRI